MLSYRIHKKIQPILDEGAKWDFDTIKGSVSAFKVGNTIYHGKVTNHPKETTHHIDVMIALQKKFGWSTEQADNILSRDDKSTATFGYYHPKQRKFLPIDDPLYRIKDESAWPRVKKIGQSTKVVELDI